MITAAKILTPAGWVGPARLEIVGQRVASVDRCSTTSDTLLVPGFIDLQVNGIDDVDVASAKSDPDWQRLDALLAAQGTTSWYPTIITDEFAVLDAVLAHIAEAQHRAGPRPDLMGVHIEGPFIGGSPGAHPKTLIRPIDLHWLAALPPIVKIVTLAPELPDAIEAIGLLIANGVQVSLGHSTATLAQCDAAAEAGATLVTHMFNAMAPLQHRNPTIANAALSDPRLVIGLIADGVHVERSAALIAVRSKGPDGVALVTDSVGWRAGSIGAVGIEWRDGAPRRSDGTLAGSNLTMAQAVRNLVSWGVEVPVAMHMAARTPARVMGLTDRGTIEVGKRADLVELSADLEVRRTWVAGALVHAA